MSNAMLESLRNGIPSREPLHARRPSRRQIEAHLRQRGDWTLFVSNHQESDVLLMLADVDNKDGRGHADQAAAHLRSHYFDEQAVIEPSTGGRGRHMYFLVNAKGWPRETVNSVIERYASHVRADPAWADMGISFDRILGLPTGWKPGVDGNWRVEWRGCTLRLPYLNDLDVRAFEDLRPLDLQWFEGRAGSSDPGPNPLPPTVIKIGVTREIRGRSGIGVTGRFGSGSPVSEPRRRKLRAVKGDNQWPDADHPNGRQRRLACVQKMMRL